MLQVRATERAEEVSNTHLSYVQRSNFLSLMMTVDINRTGILFVVGQMSIFTKVKTNKRLYRANMRRMQHSYKGKCS